MLKRLSGADRLHLLVDHKLVEGSGGAAMLDRFEKLLGIELVPILAGDSAQGALAKVPDDVKALYVVIPLRMPDSARLMSSSALAPDAVRYFAGSQGEPWNLARANRLTFPHRAASTAQSGYLASGLASQRYRRG